MNFVLENTREDIILTDEEEDLKTMMLVIFEKEV